MITTFTGSPDAVMVKCAEAQAAFDELNASAVSRGAFERLVANPLPTDREIRDALDEFGKDAPG